MPELNRGQLCRIVRAEYLVDAKSLYARCRACRSPPREIEAAIDEELEESPDDRHRPSHASPRRRTGRATRRSAGAPDAATTASCSAVQQLMPELGITPGEHGVHLRHRLLEPVPVLHEHVRDALDPRARPGDRHRRRRRPARPRRVGDHRRRRRPVDRRQPPDPRPAAQRQPHDPAVQQPDLRADQGPVLADVASSARSPSRRRSARSTRRSTRWPWRSAPRPASSPAPTTSTAST